MRRLFALTSLTLVLCLAHASLAGADEVDAAQVDPVANLSVVDIGVQLFPMLLVGMEIPVVTVEVKNLGSAPTPDFKLELRVSYYGSTASHTASTSEAGLAPGATRTISFKLRPQILGMRDPHGITALAQPFPGELQTIDNRRFEILDF